MFKLFRKKKNYSKVSPDEGLVGTGKFEWILSWELHGREDDYASYEKDSGIANSYSEAEKDLKNFINNLQAQYGTRYVFVAYSWEINEIKVSKSKLL